MEEKETSQDQRRNAERSADAQNTTGLPDVCVQSRQIRGADLNTGPLAMGYEISREFVGKTGRVYS